MREQIYFLLGFQPSQELFYFERKSESDPHSRESRFLIFIT